VAPNVALARLDREGPSDRSAPGPAAEPPSARSRSSGRPDRPIASLRPVSTGAPVELHIVSDSTGETAAKLVLALEAQFPDQVFEEIRHPRVEDVDDLALAVQRARGRPAVMVYTLVEPGLRASMRQLCRRARVHYCDLLGHPIDSISRVAGVAARMEPGARAPLDQTYFKRIEAIEFAVKYDDGVGGGLDEADIVLVGVSRTSKTPLSIYLGYLGHKAANVPIVRGVDPPRALFEVDRNKVVGLTIDAERLAEIRGERVRSMGAPRRRYADLEAVFEELETASRVHRRLRCPVIDVSDLSVEETAIRVVKLVANRSAERKARRG
jgi:regulator of PEP synthase PpsR (kinase-PPPase family)